MRTARFRLALFALPPALLAAALAGGCTSYTPPALHVTDARVSDRSEQGLVLTFTLDAENSNSVALPLREVRYTLELEGKPAFTGYRSPEATLRRFAVQQVTLPAVISAAEASKLPADARYRLTGELTYITPGEIEEILFDNEIRRPTVTFSDTGVLSLTPPH